MTLHRRTIARIAALGILALWTAAVSAGPWRRAETTALPDEAFAVVHALPDGTRARHLPHHGADGRVDLTHLRSALARLTQVRWEDPTDAERARRHLRAHFEALPAGRVKARSGDDADTPWR